MVGNAVVEVSVVDYAVGEVSMVGFPVGAQFYYLPVGA